MANLKENIQTMTAFMAKNVQDDIDNIPEYKL